MEKCGEIPPDDLNSCLTSEQIGQFQREVVIPSIDAIWGGDFISETRPGCELTRVMPVRDGLVCRLSLEHIVDYDEDGESDEAVILNLRLSYRIEEVPQEFIESYRTQLHQRVQSHHKSRYKRRKYKNITDSELDKSKKIAWEHVDYDFNFYDDGFFSVKRQFTLEVDGCECWSSEDEINWIQSSSNHRIDELESDYKNSITVEDCFLIKEALSALNVADHIISKPLD